MNKEELNYYSEFLKDAEFAVKISMILNEYIENFDYDKSWNVETKVHEIENLADQNQHKILNYLIKDFLPPIEREDIIALVYRLDDLVDNIDEVVINLDILDVNVPREDVKFITNLLNETCIKVKVLLENFKLHKKYSDIKEIFVEINGLEEKGDKLYQEAIRNLYKNEKNSIEINKWTILYNCLENCFDSCELIANCVEEIILKIG